MPSDLIVSLTLKAKDDGLRSTLKQIEQDAAKFGSSMKNASGQSTTALKSADGAVASFRASLAAIGSGITFGALIGQLSRVRAELDDLKTTAEILGIEIEKLAAIKFSAQLSDTDLNAITAAYRQISNAAAGAIQGNAQMVEAFEQLRIPIEQVKSMNPEQLFDAIAESLGRMENGVVKNELASRVFGRQYQSLIPMLNQSQEKLAAMREVFGQLNPALRASADAADSMGDSFTTMKASGSALLSTVLVPLSPIIESITRQFARFTMLTQTFGTTLGSIASGTSIKDAFSQMGDAVEQFEAAYDRMLAAAKKKPDGNIVGALLGDTSEAKAAADKITQAIEAMQSELWSKTEDGVQKLYAREYAVFGEMLNKKQVSADQFNTWRLLKESVVEKAIQELRQKGWDEDDAYAARIAKQNQEALFRAQEAAGARIEAEEWVAARFKEIYAEMAENDRTMAQGFGAGWRDWLKDNSPFLTGANAARTAIDSLSGATENFFMGIIDGTARGSEAWKRFGADVLRIAQQVLTRMAVMQAVEAGMGVLRIATGTPSLAGGNWGDWAGYGGRSGFVASQAGNLPEGFGMFSAPAAASIAGSAPKTLQSGATSAAAASAPPPSIVSQTIQLNVGKVWDSKDVMGLLSHPDAARTVKALGAEALRGNLQTRNAARSV